MPTRHKKLRRAKSRVVVVFALLSVLAGSDPLYAFDNYFYYCTFAGAGIPTRDFMSVEHLSNSDESSVLSASRNPGITWGLEFLWILHQREASSHGILTGFSLTHHRLTGNGRITDESWGTFYTLDAGYLRQLGNAELVFTPGRNTLLTRIGVSIVGHAGDVYKPFNLRPSPALMLGVGYAIPRSPDTQLVIDLRGYLYNVKFGEDTYSDNSHLQVDFLLTLGWFCAPRDQIVAQEPGILGSCESGFHQ